MEASGIVDILIGLLFRWAVSLGPYSGANKSPMFGDYEAQRHWMEVTYNLPAADWYRNTSDNDLMYWGLDYPPLTAYHSYVLAVVANRVNVSWIELHKSRGIESYHHKLFMRYTVLVADIFVFFPAVFALVKFVLKPKSSLALHLNRLTILLYPGYLLIDHGHFQYNCVSLGLFLLAVVAIECDRFLIAAALFSMGLNYKQLELYHALPFFAFLLGNCFRDKNEIRLWKLFKISAIVLTTFGVIWFPFMNGIDGIVNVLNRLFPFQRGLFEDKVANVWCSLSVVIKWQKIFTVPQLVKICFATTLIATLPTCIVLMLRPSKENFRLSLVISSLSFFLFSFHVHEKGILLVITPIFLFLNTKNYQIVFWMSLISLISMQPLFVKDETVIAFYALTFLYWIYGTDVYKIFPKSKKSNDFDDFMPKLFHLTIAFGMAICLASQIFSPPGRYPDLFTVAISVYCCACFCFTWCYFYFHQLKFLFLKVKIN